MGNKSVITYTIIKASTSYSQVKPVLSYVDTRATNIYLDAYPINQYFFETTGLADAFSFSFSSAKTDAITFTDFPSLAVTKSLTETITLSESVSKLLTIQRAYSDSVSLAEASTFSLSKSLADSLSLADNVGVATQRGLTGETVSVLDTAVISVDLSKLETVNLADVPSISLSKTFADTFAFNENFTAGYDHEQNTNNVVAIGDNFSYILISGNNAVLNTSAINTFTLNG
tara:strand:+ start:93 stop:782 length:690 start_codon:yes stop_codon:yes gene_type:complete